MAGLRVLACICPISSTDSAHFCPSSCVPELATVSKSNENLDVKILKNASHQEFLDAIDEFKPTVVYLSASADFKDDKKWGTLKEFAFSDGTSADSIFPEYFAGKGVSTLYIDAKADFEQIKAVQSRGEVQHAIGWAASAPALIASQFAHTFFSVLFTYASAPNEAFTMASYVVQAHCSKMADGTLQPPTLPTFLSALKTELPDNNSIPPPDIPDLDPQKTIASIVPGWSDLRLLAPRAEIRLLLCGDSTIIESHKLSFLGEALRALLVMETRKIKLVSTSSCSKTPVNLSAGCKAIRCEVQTASGSSAVVVLGGQPDVLKDSKLVEHALRVTLVSDAQSLQFRLPPPGVSLPAPRSSAAIAGNTPVVDTLVLSSVWAVQVLRSLCQDPNSFGLISMGIAAVGASATAGIQAGDSQRFKMLISGLGPLEHQGKPLPEATTMEHAAMDAEGTDPALDVGPNEISPLTEAPIPAPPPLEGVNKESDEEGDEIDMVPDQEGVAVNEVGPGSMEVEAGADQPPEKASEMEH